MSTGVSAGCSLVADSSTTSLPPLCHLPALGSITLASQQPAGKLGGELHAERNSAESGKKHPPCFLTEKVAAKSCLLLRAASCAPRTVALGRSAQDKQSADYDCSSTLPGSLLAGSVSCCSKCTAKVSSSPFPSSSGWCKVGCWDKPACKAQSQITGTAFPMHHPHCCAILNMALTHKAA